MGKKKGRDYGPPPKADSVLEGLKNLYHGELEPIEKSYQYPDFHSPLLKDSDLAAKPMVLLLGQYSVGKTSFIQYLLGREFPGIRIGPEPTTDKFCCVMKGPEDRVVPGNALAVHPDLPFTSLTKFGTNFLNRMEGAVCNAPLLDHITLIDTPGVLSGEKQRLGRAYDFIKVIEWFIERADMVLLLFDAHKLDISDEFRDVIVALKGNEDKVRVVLNKADRVTGQQLMRVYGAMMWALGKVVNTPEVMRVYIGSFWDEPCQNKEFQSLFVAEAQDLLRDLRELPRNSATRKVNEIVKRSRLLRTHALILGHLKSQMPSMFGKEKKQAKLIADMANQFNTVHKKYKLPIGDFPDLPRFKSTCTVQDFSKFPKLDDRINESIEDILSRHIPALLSQLEEEEAAARQARREATAAAGAGAAAPDAPVLPKPALGGGTSGGSNPFAGGLVAPDGGAGGVGEDPVAREWAALVAKAERDTLYNTMDGSSEDKVAGGAAFGLLTSTGLPQDKLRRVWDLSDHDKDGALTSEEFAVAMHLIDLCKSGKPLPSTLPGNLVPPSQR